MVPRTCLYKCGPTRGWSDADRQYRNVCPNGLSKRACPDPPQAERRFIGKENDFETANDDYDFEGRVFGGRIARWFSEDPESGEYSSLSTYMGIGNSPIYYIDIDGNKILKSYQEPKKDANGNFIVDTDTGSLQMETKYFEYKPGILPPDNDFVKNIVKALEYINGSRAGRRNIRRAIRNTKVITIVEIDKYKKCLETSNYEGTHAESFKGEVLPDGRFRNDLDKDGNLIFANMIFWDPNVMTAIVDNNGKLTNKFQSAAVSLGHEIQHINNAN